MPNYKLRRLWWFLLLPLSFILTIWAKNNPQAVENAYSTTIYPVISSAISLITGFLSFSLAEILIVFGIVFLLFYIVLFIMKVTQIHKEKRRYQIYLFFVNLGIFITILIFFFNILCGLNYYRVRPIDGMNLDISAVTDDQIYDMASQLAIDANAYRQEVESGSDGTMELSSSKEETFFEAQRIMNNLPQTSVLKQLSGAYAQPKEFRFSGILSSLGINGFFFPYTYEANVNTKVPDYMLPFTMIHEQIHVRGYMREDDTNFLAYLVTIQSQDPAFQYSGTVTVLELAISLLESNGDPRVDTLKSQLSPEVLQDIEAGKEYRNEHYGVFYKMGQGINNLFLKANNQSRGNESYQDVVRMITAYYQSAGSQN